MEKPAIAKFESVSSHKDVYGNTVLIVRVNFLGAARWVVYVDHTRLGFFTSESEVEERLALWEKEGR